MLEGKRILAVVPARSGSKGVPDKNVRRLLGTTLIGWAGRCLASLDWLDGKVISTDSAEYAAEGERHGLDAPFLRPRELATDDAGAVDTMAHALHEAERFYATVFDMVLIVEPTSPLRVPADLEGAIRLLIETGADSAVCVSPLDSKYHPRKVLRSGGGRITFYEKEGASVVARQSLDRLYYRNGVCYALTRGCLLEKRTIFSDDTVPYVVDRQIVNIDEPLELEYAEFLMRKYGFDTKGDRGA